MSISEMPVPCGIFPVYSEFEAAVHPSNLATEPADQDAIPAEDDLEAVAEMEDMVRRDWIKKFDSKHRAKKFVGGRLVTSRLFVIKKAKRAKDKRGRWVEKVKKRLLLDLKASGVSSASAEFERIIMPRVLGPIFDSLELMRAQRKLRSAVLRQIVLDFRHCFYHWPVHPAEQRYIATRLGDEWLVWFRAAQGSRGAPLLSADVASPWR